ncbi:phytanoyl-CoA dioxygenase family protein [Williamsia serinedens]|uniref:Phytanoyl-CoA dioxygenase (PhyH) n=1 Tax=Williamsia serinedens TaxID=391736 RepID=A0ABT1GYR6_9NOCA|nr:phytanoyl-CoA dioxygenase family protein [Williamsia serinedens]MCP2159423.1 Phytanoyl-CoA dioxygenase (PhyH) [Williamsia serinedens]
MALSDPTTNDRLPEQNRGGGIDQDWAGDDQDWWDWYVTLAANDAVPADLVDGPGLPDVAPASDEQVERELAEPYDLDPTVVEAFARDAFVRLPGVLSPAVVRRLAERLEELLHAEHGDDVAGRFTALEQMWLHDDLMRAVALSPRIGGLAAALLGEPAVRLYHDNALSKEPGCGRTPWHHDAEHFPLQTTQAVTAWIPMSAIPGRMGPLSFARGRDVLAEVSDLEFDKVGTSYDEAVARRFVEREVAVEAGPFAVGDVSFHSALCFHTAGPNLTTQPRRALATTYFADGARVVDSPTLISGTWREFLPGIEPGGLAVSDLNPVVGRSA